MTVHKSRQLKEMKCINPECNNIVQYVWGRTLVNKLCTDCHFRHQRLAAKATDDDVKDLYIY